MKTVTQKGYIMARDFGHGLTYTFWEWPSDEAPRGDEHYTPVMPHTLTLTLPETFNPTAHQVAALEAKKAELLREFQESAAAINHRLSKLQAIGNGVEA